MPTVAHADEFKAFVDAHQDEIIETWRKFVDQPSKNAHRADLDAMNALLKAEFESIGFECERIDVSDGNNGAAIVGTWGADRPGKPVIFSGHYDTVPLEAEDNSFRFDEQGHARGLGCLDMKGGIAVAVWVVKALQSIGWDKRPVKFLYVGDEETGHVGGNAVEVIKNNSAGALCAFNMETGLPGNEVCVGRKGAIKADFTVHGVSAHSGNEWEKGRNAIVEMSHKVLELDALTDLDAGTTATVSIVNGGTVMNSVPGECNVTALFRVETMAESERLGKACQEIADKVYIDGCTTEHTYADIIGPFETTPEGVRLAEFISSVSEEIGQGAMGQARLGGGSDAAYVTAAGVPTVCSMGVRGQFNHTANEYAFKESIFERTVLLASVVEAIDEFAEGAQA